MDIDVIMFDWGRTLARVVHQEAAYQRGAARAAAIVAPDADAAAIDRLIQSVLKAEMEASQDPLHREADLSTLLAEWVARQGGSVDRGRIAEAVQAVGESWVGALEPFPGTRQALQQLRDEGYRLGLVSNCIIPLTYSVRELQRTGAADLMDFVVISSQVGYRKPAPQIYERAVDEAFPNGRPSELSRVLFVGDSPALDVIEPARLGMKTALVTCRDGIWSREDYARARPDLRIDAVSELPVCLERLK
jgi:FMN phosphatase YigB (HAD superfamily)